MIDHDRLFKELLSTFFIEFIELFFPEVITYLEPNSITFLDKEVFTDVTAGERYEADLLVQAKFQEQSSYFLIHVENQSYNQADFNKRMFRYFARLHEKYDLPIYPVVVFSYAQPQKTAESNYQLFFPDFKVLEFNYRVVQLNQLNWRDFLNQRNPIASALMAKMQIASEDRPRVKAECLRLLITLKLDPAKMQLISGFIDTYLNLNESEEQAFRDEIGTIELEDKEEIMQIVTSWMRTGIQQGQASMVMRLLRHKFGEIDPDVEAQIQKLASPQLEDLGEALLDFEQLEDLTTWFSNH
jgi:predicted transposase/invertase (TIGR01784 family)